MSVTAELAKVEATPLKGGPCTAKRHPDDPPCQATATHGYLWEWGETGCACPVHVGELQQISETLGRRITFTALDPHAPAPMSRDERVKFNATILTLEAELAEAKQRGAELYQRVAQLSSQAQAATLRAREAESQRKDAAATAAAEEERADVVLAQLGDANDELQRVLAILDAKPNETVAELRNEIDSLRKQLAEATRNP